MRRVFLILIGSVPAWLPVTGPRAGEQADVRLFMQGDYVFQRNCATCHGKRGRGDGELAGDVAVRPRDFRKGVFKFRSTPIGFLPTDADLERTIRNGISGSMMPSFASLGDSEVRAVIAYVKGFSPRWKNPELKAAPLVIPPRPEWFDAAERAADHAAAGGKIFAAHCASCHGAAGKGDGPAGERMVDVWGDAIVPADLSKGEFRSGPEPGDLFRTIATGLDGTPMAGYGAVLEAESIWELVAFIRSLGPAEADP